MKRSLLGGRRAGLDGLEALAQVGRHGAVVAVGRGRVERLAQAVLEDGQVLVGRTGLAVRVDDGHHDVVGRGLRRADELEARVGALVGQLGLAGPDGDAVDVGRDEVPGRQLDAVVQDTRIVAQQVHHLLVVERADLAVDVAGVPDVLVVDDVQLHRLDAVDGHQVDLVVAVAVEAEGLGLGGADDVAARELVRVVADELEGRVHEVANGLGHRVHVHRLGGGEEAAVTVGGHVQDARSVTQVLLVDLAGTQLNVVVGGDDEVRDVVGSEALDRLLGRVGVRLDLDQGKEQDHVGVTSGQGTGSHELWLSVFFLGAAHDERPLDGTQLPRIGRRET